MANPYTTGYPGSPTTTPSGTVSSGSQALANAIPANQSTATGALSLPARLASVAATYIVKSTGAQLQAIAMYCYGDTKWWRALAQYNGITNPRIQLTPGTVLQIPNGTSGTSPSTNGAYSPIFGNLPS